LARSDETTLESTKYKLYAFGISLLTDSTLLLFSLFSQLQDDENEWAYLVYHVDSPVTHPKFEVVRASAFENYNEDVAKNMRNVLYAKNVDGDLTNKDAALLEGLKKILEKNDNDRNSLLAPPTPDMDQFALAPLSLAKDEGGRKRRTVENCPSKGKHVGVYLAETESYEPAKIIDQHLDFSLVEFKDPSLGGGWILLQSKKFIELPSPAEGVRNVVGTEGTALVAQNGNANVSQNQARGNQAPNQEQGRGVFKVTNHRSASVNRAAQQSSKKIPTENHMRGGSSANDISVASAGSGASSRAPAVLLGGNSNPTQNQTRGRGSGAKDSSVAATGYLAVGNHAFLQSGDNNLSQKTARAGSSANNISVASNGSGISKPPAVSANLMITQNQNNNLSNGQANAGSGIAVACPEASAKRTPAASPTDLVAKQHGNKMASRVSPENMCAAANSTGSLNPSQGAQKTTKPPPSAAGNSGTAAGSGLITGNKPSTGEAATRPSQTLTFPQSSSAGGRFVKQESKASLGAGKSSGASKSVTKGKAIQKLTGPNQLSILKTKSTTTYNFSVGDPVVAPWADGQYYPGVIASIDDSSESALCTVNFKDGDVMKTQKMDLIWKKTKHTRNTDPLRSVAENSFDESSLLRVGEKVAWGLPGCFKVGNVSSIFLPNNGDVDYELIRDGVLEDLLYPRKELFSEEKSEGPFGTTRRSAKRSSSQMSRAGNHISAHSEAPDDAAAPMDHGSGKLARTGTSGPDV